jgi:predicted nucleotidyltransferase
MTLPNLRELLAALAEAGVEYVAIGGIAVGLHGAIRTTEDLDIVPNPHPINIDRLCVLLEAEEATLLLNPRRRFGPREAWLLRRGRNLSVSTRHGDLDVVRTLPGVPSYDSLFEDAERYDLDGITVHAASPEQLIKMKQVRRSIQDAADIESLRLLEDNDA